MKRFRLVLIMRIVGLALTAGALAWLVIDTRLYEAWLVAAGLLVWQAAALVRQASGAVRDLTRLLEAVRASDFSQTLPTEGRGPLIAHFGAAFDEVADEFKRLRAEKEEQVRYLENVVRHVGVALIAFRADGSVQLINRAARRLLGVHPVRHINALEEQVSRPLVEALRRLQSGQQTLVKVPQGGVPGGGGTEEGQAMQLSVYATRFRLRGEEHVLASMQDIRNELEEKEMEAWQQLTRVLTHEIMNSVAPIASLAGTASRLLGDEQESGQDERGEAAEERQRDTREALTVIERRSEALMSFVDAYRSFTRIPAPNFEMIAVERLLRSVQRLVGAQAQTIAVDVDAAPPALMLTADPDLVEQVLINLTLNSVQALEGQSEARRPPPRVVLRARPSPSGLPYLQVVDNGPGIPPDVQERIFVPFFTTKEGGSGIGLSLTRQIMRLHGGGVSVRSGDGGPQVEGFPDATTVFTLRF
jgi:nitrogen fixation/metabolism regulation signal transduction histidine kinase